VQEGAAGKWQSAFSEGQKVRARVVFVDPTAKKVCLSLLPHLLHLTKPELPEIGSLIKVPPPPPRALSVQGSVLRTGVSRRCLR